MTGKTLGPEFWPFSCFLFNTSTNYFKNCNIVSISGLCWLNEIVLPHRHHATMVTCIVMLLCMGLYASRRIDGLLISVSALHKEGYSITKVQLSLTINLPWQLIILKLLNQWHWLNKSREKTLDKIKLGLNQYTRSFWIELKRILDIWTPHLW